MSGRIELTVSDIDGTLVRDDKSLSDAVVAAAGRLRDAGVPLSLISARGPAGIGWIAEKLALDGNVGAFNGGTILDAKGDILSAERLTEAVAKRALALLEGHVDIWLFADGRWYSRAENPHDPRERLSANLEPTLVRDFTGLTARVDKLVGVSDDHDALAALEKSVAEALGDAATVARSQPYFLDITARLANKGDGIAALAKAAGVDLARVAVLGDQRNDLPMFARAGLSIAMGQASDEVRGAADETTASNADDGVAQAIDRIILPRAKR